MQETLNREDVLEIYQLVVELLDGKVVEDESIESRIEHMYGLFGVEYMLPWVFELVESALTGDEIIGITFLENKDIITLEDFGKIVKFYKLETAPDDAVLVEEAEIPFEKPQDNAQDDAKDNLPVDKPEVAIKSKSLSALVEEIYLELIADDPEIKSVNAKRVICDRLNIPRTGKGQPNSVRAILVKLKKKYQVD